MVQRMNIFSIAAAAAACFASGVPAQDFPNRQVKILVGFPAGGPSDIPARFIADKLRVSLNQPVVVENKTGASGMLALNDMLAQPRDGHTLLLCSYIDPTNTLLYKNPTYKLADLASISLVSKAYYAFTVPADLPVNSLAEFIAYAKERPGKLNYGRVGSGSVTELLARQLEQTAGISMVGVTFRGTGPALQEVAAGRLEFMVGPLAVTLPLYEGGKVKIIGMTSPERLAVAPKVSTLKEQGVDIVNYGWWGVCGAAGIPQPVVDRLNKEVVAIVKSDEFRALMERAGAIATASTIAEMNAAMTETATDAGRMIKQFGIEQLE